MVYILNNIETSHIQITNNSIILISITTFFLICHIWDKLLHMKRFFLYIIYLELKHDIQKDFTLRAYLYNA